MTNDRLCPKAASTLYGKTPPAASSLANGGSIIRRAAPVTGGNVGSLILDQTLRAPADGRVLSPFSAFPVHD